MKAKKNRPLGRPRSSDQKQPTEAIIIQAATELFLADGYQKVSVDDVAAKCGLTKATVYYYYKSKAALFTETMVQMMLRIRGHMEKMLQADAPLYDRLLQVAEAHLRATVNLDLDGFMRETKNSLSIEQLTKVRQAEENMFSVLEETFEKAIEAGEIPAINTKFAAHSYVALLKVGNYRHPDKTGIFPSTGEAAETIVTFFRNGISKK